jgi:hypothetical protein
VDRLLGSGIAATMKGTLALRGQRHDRLLPAPRVPFSSPDEERIYQLERQVVHDLQIHGWVASTVDAADVLVLIEAPAAGHPPFRSGELDGRPFFAITTDPDRAGEQPDPSFGLLPNGWLPTLLQFLAGYERAANPEPAPADASSLSTRRRTHLGGGSFFEPELASTLLRQVPLITQGEVFISYSRADQAYVDDLVKYLEAAGCRPWIDRTGIEHGKRWSTVVRDAIDRCSALIAVMSEDADSSDWVERELQRAEDRGITIFPLLLGGEVFFGLGNLQYEDVRDGTMPSATFVLRVTSACRRR